MAEFKKYLDRLKVLLERESDFSVIGKYFFNHLGNNSEFIKNGKAVKNPLLKKIIRKACHDFINKDQQLTKLLMIHVNGYPVFHGAFFIGPHLSNYFYFEELKKGMIMIVRSMETGDVSYIRFTGTVIPGKGLTIAPGNKIVQ